MPTKPTAVMGRRIGAYLIDGVLASLVGFLVFLATADKVPNSTTGRSGFNLDLGDTHYHSGGGVVVLAWLVYSLVAIVGLTGAKGLTPGKALVGIRVANAEGNPPGFGRALVRWLFLIVDNFFFFLVGLITALTSENNQRVGDMVAKTYVVGKEAVGHPLPLTSYQPASAGAYPPGPPPGIGPAAPNPDWYPDPSGQARLRYWDGQKWTDNTS